MSHPEENATKRFVVGDTTDMTMIFWEGKPYFMADDVIEYFMRAKENIHNEATKEYINFVISAFLKITKK